MIMVIILVPVTKLRPQSHGMGRTTMAASSTKLMEMDDASDGSKGLHEPHGLGSHSWETGWQRVRKTTKKVMPKHTVNTMRDMAHLLKLAVLKMRM